MISVTQVSILGGGPARFPPCLEPRHHLGVRDAVASGDLRASNLIGRRFGSFVRLDIEDRVKFGFGHDHPPLASAIYHLAD